MNAMETIESKLRCRALFMVRAPASSRRSDDERAEQPINIATTLVDGEHLMKTMILTLLVTQIFNNAHVTHGRYSDLAALIARVKRALCGELDPDRVEHHLASGRGVAPRVQWREVVITSMTSVAELTRAWRAQLSGVTTTRVIDTRVDTADELQARSVSRHAMGLEYCMMNGKLGWNDGSAFRPHVFGLNISQG